MLDKLKHSLSLTKQQSPAPKLLPQLISIFQSEDIKSSKQVIQNIKETLNFLSQIASTNKQAIKSYIAQQVKSKQEAKDEEDEKYTFEEDLSEIQTNMKDVISNFKLLQEVESKIQTKIEKLVGNKVDDAKYRQLEGRFRGAEDEVRKRDEEVRGLKEQMRIFKENQTIEAELLMNSKMQTGLLTNEVRQLQEKLTRYQKEMLEKDNQLSNLQEQKKHLLSMNTSNPQIEALKNQLTETEKRYSIEKSKLQQKQKQIEQGKKRIEEEKNNLISMADDLKKSEFKQQEIAKKYESSKTEIRKYRQIKMEEIKKLNEEVGELKARQEKFNSELNQLKSVIKHKDEEIERVKQGYQNAVSNTIKHSNLQQQIKILDQNLKESAAKNEEKSNQIETLQSQLLQLKEKRQSLLRILEQPVRHEIHNLEKIHKHMEILYKDYIVEVFENGNVVGFERKIKDIMANVMELREDLLM